jgi:AcrR family transcriptional regulator
VVATPRRDRYRAETRREVKERALNQLAEHGAEGLSINAIAKAMGMSGPALYRYFANRAELLTELIIDAYNDLADAMEAAAGGGLRAVAGAMRDWAHGEPHRYLLLFGTPIPQYEAPDEATIAARRSMAVLLEVLLDSHGAASATRRRKTYLENEVEQAFWVPETHRGKVSGRILVRALLCWTRLHGVLSLEVSGAFGAMGFQPAYLYDLEVETLLSTEV